MGETDRQTTKGWHTSRWAFVAYEGQWHLFDQAPPPGIAEWGWQKEMCPKTDKLHYQGYLRTTQQQRVSWFKNSIPGVHVEKCGWKTPEKPQSECWKALVNYCKKKDTAVDGVHHHAVSLLYTQYTYAEHLGATIYQDYTEAYRSWSDEECSEVMDAYIRLDISRGHRELMWITKTKAWLDAWQYWKSIFNSYSIKPHGPPSLSEPQAQNAQDAPSSQSPQSQSHSI